MQRRSLPRDDLQQHEVQTHVVIDRFSQGHTLLPGQRKHDVELPNDEIANFQEQRRPDRFFPTTDPTTPGCRSRCIQS